jgi:Arm DNA-binding domain
MAKANALSAVFVKQCRKPGVYRDGQGLILRVESTGTKRWVLRVTLRGKSRDIGLGSANDVSLIEARDRAHELRRLVRDGIDPIGAQRAARTTIPTFAEAAEIVHRQRLKGWSNGKHRDQWLSTFLHPEDKRKTERELRNAFDIARPRILWPGRNAEPRLQ